MSKLNPRDSRRGSATGTPRIRVDDLVPLSRIDDRQDRVPDERLSAAAADDLVRRDGNAPRAREVTGDRLAERLDPGRGRVAGLPLRDRADAGEPDVIGRREVRLSDAERDDVLPVRDQLGDLAENDEGVLGAQLT